MSNLPGFILPTSSVRVRGSPNNAEKVESTTGNGNFQPIVPPDHLVHELIQRVHQLEKEVAAYKNTTQPLLHDLFNKCNVLDENLKAWKAEVDGRLKEIVNADNKAKGPRSRDLRPRTSSGLPKESGLVDTVAVLPSSLSLSEEEMLEPEPPELKPLQCKLCPEGQQPVFELAEDLASHYTSQHESPLPIAAASVSAIGARSGIINSKLTQTLRTASDNEQHRKQKSTFTKTKKDSRKSCSECGQNFTTLQNLRRHVRNLHTNSSYTCDICGVICRRNDTLKHHKSKMHGDTSQVFLTATAASKTEPNYKKRARNPKLRKRGRVRVRAKVGAAAQVTSGSSSSSARTTKLVDQTNTDIDMDIDDGGAGADTEGELTSSIEIEDIKPNLPIFPST